LGSLGSRILEESSHPRICSARNAADVTLPPHERPRAAPAHTRGDKQTKFDHTTTISPHITVRAIRPMRSAFITCSASRTVDMYTRIPLRTLPCDGFFARGGNAWREQISQPDSVCVPGAERIVRKCDQVPPAPPTFGARPHASHADAHRGRS
jgi:hypothetical protein